MTQISPGDRSGRPLVSVCIPTYRGERYLPATIESVLAQTYEHWILYIVDDQSPDATAALVAKYDDPRVRYVRNDVNLGAQGNWNRCLDLVEGKYFKLLPHDDLLAPECLSRQVEVLEADAEESLSFAFCARRIIGEDGRELMLRRFPGPSGQPIQGAEAIRQCVRRGTNLFGEPGGILMRTAAALKVGPFDATNPYVVDLDYWVRLLAVGPARYVDEPLVAFRVSRQQWSVAIGRGQSTDFMSFVRRIQPHLDVRLSATDLALGRMSSMVNSWLRLAFYAYHFR